LASFLHIAPQCRTQGVLLGCPQTTGAVNLAIIMKIFSVALVVVLVVLVDVVHDVCNYVLILFVLNLIVSLEVFAVLVRVEVLNVCNYVLIFFVVYFFLIWLTLIRSIC
jgi:hypothetical protein